jgi:hypothetical protein
VRLVCGKRGNTINQKLSKKEKKSREKKDMAMTCGDITLMAKTRKVKTNKGFNKISSS